MIDRIKRGTGATIGFTVSVDGSATDPSPDSATVIVRDSAGATVVASTAATDSGTGTFSYNLTPAHTALLDTLTATWTYTRSGNQESQTTTHEIVGGFVFTIAEARALSGLGAQNNDNSYRISTAALVAARTEVERALEQELCFAMVPRYTRVVLDGEGGSTIGLRVNHPRLIRSVTVDGTTWTPSALAFNPGGFVYSASAPWTTGFQNVIVGVEHGLDYPPARAKDVALALTRRAVAGTPADDRATSVSTEQETTTFYVPGGSEPFDIPAANRFVAANTLRTGVA